MIDDPDISELTKTSSFRGGWGLGPRSALVLQQIDALVELGELDGYLLRLKDDGRWEMFLDFEWLASLVCADDDGQILVTGPDGRVSIIEGNDELSEELVFGEDSGSAGYGPIRYLTLLNGAVTVCGMSRRILSRDKARNVWMPSRVSMPFAA